MSTKAIRAVALAGVMCASAQVMAEGAYVGMDYSIVKADITADWYAGKFSADPTALRFKVGTGINQNFAVEGYFATGLSEDTIEGDLEAEVDSMFGIAAKGIIPASESFALYGKLGFAKVTFEDSVGDKYKGDGLEYGVGAQFNVSEAAAIVLEYSFLPDADNDYWEIDVESEVISIGFQANL